MPTTRSNARVQTRSRTRRYSIRFQHLSPVRREKLFECDACHKRYFRESYKNDHESTHVGRKYYVCSKPNCGEAYYFKAGIAIHLRTHTIPCIICDKIVKNIGALKKHLKAHDGVHRCPKCNRKFAKRVGLVMHFKVCRFGQNNYRLLSTCARYRRMPAYRLPL